MSEFKFKNNVPKSFTASNISAFDILDLNSQETDNNNILGLDIEQCDSDNDERETTNELLKSFTINLPPQSIQDSKLSSSRSLTMSQSRTKDELIPDNFTEKSIERLENINELLNLKDNADTINKQKIKNRLTKKINSLRIIKKNFSFNLPLGIYNQYDFKVKDISTLNNQLLLKYDNYVKRYILDVDYFRCQDVCDNDQFQYLAMGSYDQNKIVLSNNRQQLLIYDVEKAKKKSITLSCGIGQDFCSTFQVEKNVNFIKTQDNLLLMSSDGSFSTFDTRNGKQVSQWRDYSDNKEGIKFIDHIGQKSILTYNNSWTIVDQRKPEPFKQNPHPNLKKAMFMNQENNILNFQEQCLELNVFNLLQNNNFKIKDMQYPIVDVLNIKSTKELVVLGNKEIEKNKWTSQFSVIDWSGKKLKERDQIEFTLVEPITNIQIDKSQQLIYGINIHNVGVWRFNNNEEMYEIKSNLLKVAN